MYAAGGFAVAAPRPLWFVRSLVGVRVTESPQRAAPRSRTASEPQNAPGRTVIGDPTTGVLRYELDRRQGKGRTDGLLRLCV